MFEFTSPNHLCKKNIKFNTCAWNNHIKYASWNMASLAFLYTKQKATKTMLNVQSYDLPLADFKCKQKELGPLGLV